ncbi:MAG: cobalamin-binding protein [Candidatus Mcinerneyibacterium aminivorans]|uniref:Cobalamin-binding protein n=1 Tax=Candidatus Mcinerneyibacterium aminivorans TaxID=2703815 RepID=A0A5D0MFL7_9BACT|nr:MAG: cobalamin-binding protein [Candidatus Mcinerneyibacterium aminivorans]
MNEKIVNKIKNNVNSIAEKVLKKQLNINKNLKQNYNEYHKKKCLEDIKYHLNYLTEALANSEKDIFSDYALWAKILLNKLGIATETLIENFNIINAVLSNEYSLKKNSKAVEYINYAINILVKEEEKVKSFITDKNPLKEEASKYLEFILNAKKDKAVNLIMKIAKESTPVREIYLNIFQPVQHEIGRLWHTNKISVGQEHYSTAVTQLVMSRLYSFILNSDNTKNKTMIAASIGEELHEIGIRMVADFFEMDGWNTYFYGANTPNKTIINSIQKVNADIIALSVTIAYHLSELKKLISQIRENKKTKNIKIIVGGYIFNKTPGLWKKVGADGYAENAQKAIKTVDKLLRE